MVTSLNYNVTITKLVTYIGVFFLLFISNVSYGQWSTSGRESNHYEIKNVEVPEGISLEVGGLAFDDQGKLGVSTRRGEIWVIKNPASNSPKFTRFAHGLHEALGLNYRDGSFLSTQRGELTKLTDTNNDGEADAYRTIYSWPLAANYHEYSYGPVFLPDGDMLLSLNLGWIGRGASLSKWRGWMVKVTNDGVMTPLATGMRSPAGYGLNAEGDIFYAENQGDWVGSGRMTHVEVGDFVGNPEGLKWTGEEGSPLSLKMEDITDTLGYTLYEYAKHVPEIKPPSVWFPHGLMGISTSDVLLIDNDKFGPFENQLLVGDQGHSTVMRVFQEKVNGVYQGICFPFREGFSSGVLRLLWGPDHSLYVGQTNRGWSSTGKEPFALERLIYNDKMPFEIKEVRAMPDGFELEFTQPVDAELGANADSYSISDFTFKYHHIYGSPVTDLQERKITGVQLSDNKRTARLIVEGLREGYVNEIKAIGVKSTSGKTLIHNFGYYTLNQIPEGGMSNSHASHDNASSGGNVNVESAKRITEMPASWGNEVDETITLTVQARLRFDKEEITVKAGTKLKFVLDNPDDMLHNMLLVKPGTADAVAKQAMDLGLIGQEKGYVPNSDEVLYHTGLLQPNSSEIIYFEVPSEPGEYQYVCTFPGHAMSMRGVLKVVK